MEEGSRYPRAASTQHSGPFKVLLIGATGFIGSRILQALQERTDTLVSILARRPEALSSTIRPTVFRGNLSDPASLNRAARSMDVVINAASYVGGEPDLARKINHDGTLAVIRACQQARVGRLIQLSTTAIYGTGPHRAVYPWDLPYHPESTVSRSRAAADQAVLSAGGITVRPNLIHGVGDRWFIPGAIRMFTTLGSRIDEGRALLSLIDVESLGALVAALAVTPQSISGAFHAAHPDPTPVGSLLTEIEQQVAPLGLSGSVSLMEATDRLETTGFRPHQINMLGADHHYHSKALWDIAGLKPGIFRLSSAASRWYRANGPG